MNNKEKLKEIKEVPTYKNLVFCLKVLTGGCNVEEFKLVNDILKKTKG